MKRTISEEKKAVGKNKLNCYPLGPRNFNYPPAEKQRPVEITSAFNSIWVFSLPLAITLAKTQAAINQNIMLSHSIEASALREEWSTKAKPDMKVVEPTFSMKGFAIGWKVDDGWLPNLSKETIVYVCKSPEVSAAVLSRIESGLLLLNLNPVYSIDRILDGPFAFSEPVLKDESLFLKLDKSQIDQNILT